MTTHLDYCLFTLGYVYVAMGTLLLVIVCKKRKFFIHFFERNNSINLYICWFAYSVYNELISYHLEGMPTHVGQM